MTLEQVKETGRQLVTQMRQAGLPAPAPGSLAQLLWGIQPCQEAIMSRFGSVGLELVKQIISSSHYIHAEIGIGLDMVYHGEYYVVWLHRTQKTLYFRELLSQVELDPVKTRNLFQRLNRHITSYWQGRFREYQINTGVLHWSVYQLEDLSNHDQFRFQQWGQQGLRMETFSDFLSLVGFSWSRQDYLSYWQELGRLVIDHQLPPSYRCWQESALVDSGEGLTVGLSGSQPIRSVSRVFTREATDSEVQTAAEGLLLLREMDGVK